MVGSSMFVTAVSVAARALGDGRRKDTRELFLTHALDVAQALGPEATMVELSAAVLHDVLEDSDWTEDDLERSGVDRTVLEAVKTLTRAPNEDDEDFVARICATPDAVGVTARRVKVADVAVNLANARSREELEHYERRLSIVRDAAERYG